VWWALSWDQRLNIEVVEYLILRHILNIIKIV